MCLGVEQTVYHLYLSKSTSLTVKKLVSTQVRVKIKVHEWKSKNNTFSYRTGTCPISAGQSVVGVAPLRHSRLLRDFRATGALEKKFVRPSCDSS
jgi:hypothetical protein